jgi:hypothetical protein
METKIIAHCGLDCAKCDAFIARKNDDNELRKKTAALWSKQFNFECTPEMINCVGCIATSGPQIGHCAQCEIRLCGLEKGNINCAACAEYATCEKLAGFLKNVPDAKATLGSERTRMGMSA